MLIIIISFTVIFNLITVVNTSQMSSQWSVFNWIIRKLDKVFTCHSGFWFLLESSTLVLKYFHNQDKGLFRFLKPGWTRNQDTQQRSAKTGILVHCLILLCCSIAPPIFLNYHQTHCWCFETQHCSHTSLLIWTVRLLLQRARLLLYLFYIL